MASAVGMFDAHCHPTDIMASIDDIEKMQCRCLTIMASRSQDQELVAEVTRRYPLKERKDLDDPNKRFVIPAFGWHPWFSYQMVDDRKSSTKGLPDGPTHFKQVLTPTPTVDDEDYLKNLPEPRSLSQYLHETEERLLQHPLGLVGEVGLDRAFRLPVAPFHPPGQVSNKAAGHGPEDYTPGSREGRSLTPFKVSMDHQKTVLRAQLELAAKHRRAVSVHSVQSHGVVLEVLQDMWRGHEKPSKRERKRRKSASNAHEAKDDSVMNDTSGPDSDPALPFPPRLCMHSYSGPPDPLKQFFHNSVPIDIFFSFSDLVNFSSSQPSPKAASVIEVVPDSQILVESDYHCAGKDMDNYLVKIVEKVCELKGWESEEGARILRNNWERFVFGDK